MIIFVVIIFFKVRIVIIIKPGKEKQNHSYIFGLVYDNTCLMWPGRKYLCREKRRMMKFNILFYN